MRGRSRPSGPLAVLPHLLLVLAGTLCVLSVSPATAERGAAASSSWVRRKLQQAYTSLGGAHKVFESYPIDWNAVESSPAARTVQVNDIGACFCDLTANACDTNCCCDAKCDAQGKALFTGCLPESPDRPRLDYCVPKSIVQNVNLKSSGSLAVVYKTTPKKDFFSELLCVEKDNNPAFGNFFMDPGAGSGDKLTTALAADPFAAYETSVLTSQEAVSFESSYKANETISIAYASSNINGTLATPKYAALALPVAVFGEECREVELVGFVADVPGDSRQETKKCVRASSSLSVDCFAGIPLLDPPYYVSDLNVATTPAKSAYVNVTIAKISQLTYDTNEIADLSSTALSAIAYDAGTSVCSNVLRSLKYTITHNGNGVISQVSADLVLTDIQSDASGSASLEQEFSVVFEKEGSTATVRGKSGNPGYRVGYQVLFGVETTDTATQKQAVSQFTSGLPFISSGDGQGTCSSQYTSTLPFGSQSMGSCKMLLTREQLKKFCTLDATAFAPPAVPNYCPIQTTNAVNFQNLADPSTPLPVQLLSGLFGTASMGGVYNGMKAYVGTWGDSDPSNIADWLQAEVESIDEGMSWNEQESTCSKVISGIESNFFTASVGSQQNPQQKLAYARVRFTYDDWTFNQVGLDTCPQSFNVYSTSAFVEMGQEVEENVKPPAPPVFPKLPEDAFYPFLTN